MSPETRLRVREEAMLWLGTPYHHQGRVRGVGVDCAMLPAAVYEAAGVIQHVEPSYTRDWHLHQSGEQYIEWVLSCGGEEIDPSAGQMGDLMLWRWGRSFSHGAIIIDERLVIHSWLDLGVTLDDRTTHQDLLSRPRRCFTMGAG